MEVIIKKRSVFSSCRQVACFVLLITVELSLLQAYSTALAALVHITLSSANQSHKLRRGEIWLLDAHEYPCFSSSQTANAKMYARVGFFLFLRCLRVADSCSLCQQSDRRPARSSISSLVFSSLVARFTKKQIWKYGVLSAPGPAGRRAESSDALLRPSHKATRRG